MSIRYEIERLVIPLMLFFVWGLVLCLLAAIGVPVALKLGKIMMELLGLTWTLC